MFSCRFTFKILEETSKNTTFLEETKYTTILEEKKNISISEETKKSNSNSNGGGRIEFVCTI